MALKLPFARTVATFVFSLFATCIFGSYDAAATTLGDDPVLDSSFLEARALIDNARGGSDFDSAQRLLSNILQVDQEYAPAFMEQARIVVKQSFRHQDGAYHHFSEQGIALAVALLEHAIMLEPEFADSYVLYGYLAGSQSRSGLGLALLDEAERLNSTSGWLQLNRAQLLEQLERPDEAKRIYDAALRSELGDGQRNNALHGLIRISLDLTELIGYHEELIQANPGDEAAASSYVSMLHDFGQFEDAVERAELGMTMFPEVPWFRQARALAMYGKAAMLAFDDGDALAARAAYQQAVSTGYPPGYALLSSRQLIDPAPIALGLLRLGADVNFRNRDGYSILDLLVSNLESAELREMIDAGAEVDGCRCGPEPPLFTAIRVGKPENVALLLQAGADQSPYRSGGKTAIEAARAAGHQDIVVLLDEIDSGPTLDELIVQRLERGVRAVEAASIASAIDYLHQNASPESDLIEAMQFALVVDARKTVELIPRASFVLPLVCGAARGDDPEVSVENRYRVVREANAQRTGQLMQCELALGRVQPDYDGPVPMDTAITPENRSSRIAEVRRFMNQKSATLTERNFVRQVSHELVATDPTDPDARLLMARNNLHSAEGNYFGDHSYRGASSDVQSAIDHLEATLRSRPTDSVAAAFYADALQRSGLPGAALAMLETARTLDPANPRTDYFHAKLLFSEGDFTAAMAVLDGIPKQQGPDALQVERRLLRAVAGSLAGDSPLVLGQFEALVDFAPDNAFVLRTYGEYLLRVRGDFEHAAEVGSRLGDIRGGRGDRDLAALARFALGARVAARRGRRQVRSGTNGSRATAKQRRWRHRDLGRQEPGDRCRAAGDECCGTRPEQTVEGRRRTAARSDRGRECGRGESASGFRRRCEYR